MLYITHKRLYLLKNLGYIHYSSYLKHEIIRPFQHKIVNNTRHIFEKELLNPEVKLFWDNAPNTLKNDLIKSYQYSMSGRKQTLNVETINWTNLAFIKKTTNSLKSEFTYRSLVRLHGTHNTGLRFANIHLCIDLIQGKKIYQIHWDEYYPLTILNALKHHLSFRNNIFR